jgi:hypothetical protein
MVGEQIRKERTEYAKSTLQPRNRYGELSREYIESYGTKGIKASKEEIKTAKYIWDGTVSRNVDLSKTK